MKPACVFIFITVSALSLTASKHVISHVIKRNVPAKRSPSEATKDVTQTLGDVNSLIKDLANSETFEGKNYSDVERKMVNIAVKILTVCTEIEELLSEEKYLETKKQEEKGKEKGTEKGKNGMEQQKEKGKGKKDGKGDGETDMNKENGKEQQKDVINLKKLFNILSSENIADVYEENNESLNALEKPPDKDMLPFNKDKLQESILDETEQVITDELVANEPSETQASFKDESNKTQGTTAAVRLPTHTTNPKPTQKSPEAEKSNERIVKALQELVTYMKHRSNGDLKTSSKGRRKRDVMTYFTDREKRDLESDGNSPFYLEQVVAKQEDVTKEIHVRCLIDDYVTDMMSNVCEHLNNKVKNMYNEIVNKTP